MMEDLLTPLEAAKYIRVHRETLYDLIRSGTISAAKIGGRWRVPRSNLDRFLRGKFSVPLNPLQESLVVGDILAPEPTLQRRSEPLGPATPVGKRILVVDDNSEVREFFQIALTKRGHAVTTVANGYDAVEQVKRAVYDFVFIDLVMPQFDGIETLTAVRSIDPDPTVVLITGYPDGDLVTKALGMGPFVLLDKPIRVVDLLKVVEGSAHRYPPL